MDQEFRQQQRRRATDVGSAQHRAKVRTCVTALTQTVIFLGELTKFGLVPEHVVFHVLKVLMDDFASGAIEVLAVLLETCGRYLIRTPATAVRMQAVLDQLQRKRTAFHAEPRLALLLDNAYYHCVPPERPIMERKEQSPMQQFLAYLFTQQLNKSRFDQVLHLVRRLNWNAADVRAELFAWFTQPWMLRYPYIYLLAAMLYELQTWHAPFVVHVLDAVCEGLDADLATAELTAAQRRIARAHYLGELYNYRLVNSDVVLDELWHLCMHGGSNDTRDDYTRVRLVCTLLDTCGACFDRGLMRRRMDEFLVAFHAYILSKAPPPADVAYMLRQSVAALRPRLRWNDDDMDQRALVQQQFEAVLPHFQQRDLASLVTGAAVASDNLLDDDEEDSDDDSDVTTSGPRRRSNSPDDDIFDEVADAFSEPEPEDTQAALDEQADAELEHELTRLMAESSGGAPGVSSAVERSRTLLADASATRMRAPSVAPPAAPDSMAFSLLSRNGRGTQTQTIHLPSTASISVRTRQQQAAEAAERQQLKEYVLAYREREE